MSEFNIIKHYFAAQTQHRTDVRIGIGDDAAIVSPPPGCELIITTDTLVSGVHFPITTAADDIGYKALAVNLSDLAAMGATPAWVTLALTLPQEDPAWLQAFCDGFFTLTNKYQVQLIGGDLTRGPLSITVQALGFTLAQQAILRSTAQPGDLIYVTGTLGDAGLALRYLQQNRSPDADLLARLNRPEPRIETGLQLRSLASAAIDISDGLAADLTHVLQLSQVGAILHVDQLPLSAALTHAIIREDAIALALTAGDDYELCFTLPREKKLPAACHATCIGEITAQPGLQFIDKNGKEYHVSVLGYQHF